MEKEYVVLYEASRSAFNGGDVKKAAAAAELVDERKTAGSEEVDEEEEELELGLSLGVNNKNNNNNKVTTSGKVGGGWGDYCRILTAKDFPATAPLRSRASPDLSSSSSSVSSSPIAASNRIRVCEPGSANPPPSQVVVGWPPVRAFRINSLINPPKEDDDDDDDDNTSSDYADAIADQNTTKKKKKNKNKNSSSDDQSIDSKKQEIKRSVGVGHGGSSTALRFVKVNMDGDPIGRKVDLSAHHSYHTLAMALEIMFHKPTIQLCSSSISSHHSIKASKLLDGSAEFALTYEDKDGDWMLVGDVPWGMFLDTVKRLRIMRTSDANGLSLARFQSSAGGLLRSKPT